MPDELFCNGPDQCQDGLCSDHAGDPCRPELVCEETLRDCGPCGDVSCDALVTEDDAVAVAEFAVGALTCGEAPFVCPSGCDVTPPAMLPQDPAPGDGVCDIGDALRMAQCAAGLVDCEFGCGTFVCEEPAEPPVPVGPGVHARVEVAGCAVPGEPVLADLVLDVGNQLLGAYTVEIACGSVGPVLVITEVRGGGTAEFTAVPAHEKNLRPGECHVRLGAFQATRLDGPMGEVRVAQIALAVKEGVPAGTRTGLLAGLVSVFDTTAQPLPVQNIIDAPLVVGGCVVDGDCDDGDRCTGQEICDPATCQCQPGTPVRCEDANLCNGAERCVPESGACLPGTPLSCDDGDACNGEEHCLPEVGCQPGTPLVCEDNDGNACTRATCLAASGCALTPVPDGTPCDVATNCLADTCLGGQCIEPSECTPIEVLEEQQVTEKKPVVEAICTGEEGDVCEAQAFFLQEVEVTGATQRPEMVGAATGAAVKKNKNNGNKKNGEKNKNRKCQRLTQGVVRGTQITSEVSKRVNKKGQANLKLKLNPVGKCLLRDAFRRGQGLEVTVQATLRRPRETRSLLSYLVRLVKRNSASVEGK